MKLPVLSSEVQRLVNAGVYQLYRLVAYQHPYILSTPQQLWLLSADGGKCWRAPAGKALHDYPLGEAVRFDEEAAE